MPDKIFVLDTNVLLHDSGCLTAFGKGNEVVIPITVLEELDQFKKRQDEVGRNARKVTRDLDALRGEGKHLSEGVELSNGGRLRIELKYQDAASVPSIFNSATNDVRILGLALHLTNEYKGKKPVVLISKDINLRVKSDAVQVATEDYENKTVNISELFSGHRIIQIPDEEINSYYRDKAYRKPIEPVPLANEFAMLQSETNPDHTALGRYFPKENVLLPLTIPDDSDVFGIRPLNREQRYTLELLMDDKISLIALVGIAGTGKTLLALAAGLEKVVNTDTYRRLLVSKPIMPMGKDIGYLPGDVDEKLMPRMQSVSDNLEFLFMTSGGIEGGEERLQELIEDGIIELEPLTYIRGRSIPRQFIIVDEAQNLTPLELKTIITRAGKGSKIVLCGDAYQIDHPYLDAGSNGLTYVIECFKGSPLFGTVTLTKGERSELAETAALLM
ncbi:TPA: phosphate starvation-inducible protein PhoH [bacterium]|nr:MAG: phosphate starvation-inducible protein PhoH [Candidatus Hydrogenedentes bacterium CG07_land_8_20_14_0_80_42_17]HBW47164.1 phosphate starvation-inducible protein PhoH [bacterium]